MRTKFLFLLIVFSTLLFPQETLTIKEAIKIALENNYQIMIAEKDRENAANNASVGTAGFLPELNASGSYTESITDTKLEFFDGRVIDRTGAQSDNLNAGASLRWTIFDGLKMFASLNQLKELEEIGEVNFKISVENNISDVIDTYYNIVKEKQVLKVIQRNISISEERVRIATDELEVGSGSRFDLKQAQVDLNADKSSFLREELRFDQLKIRLNELLGRNGNFEFEVENEIDFRTDLELEELYTSLKQNNSELLKAERNKAVADLEINIAKSEWYPIINLNAGYNFTRSQSEAGFTQSTQTSGFNYGISASFNIFNGLNTRRRIENAEIMLKENELEYKQIKNNLEAGLLNAYRRYQNSLQLVNLETENLEIAKDNVEIALEKLKLGTITPLEFREVQRKLLNAESSLVTAKYEAKSAETELLRLSGELIH